MATTKGGANWDYRKDKPILPIQLKPKIRIIPNGYLCVDEHVSAIGESSETAYENWKRQILFWSAVYEVNGAIYLQRR